VKKDRQTQTEVARWCRSRLEKNGYKKMEAHSKDRTDWAGIVRETKALQGP
jgi:hypothetical protein